MSRLEELEEELYGKKGEEEAARRMRRRVEFPGTLKKIPTGWFGRERPSEDGVRRFSRRFIRWFFASVAVIFIALAAVFLFFYLGTRGQEAEVTIRGRDSVEAGELLTIPVTLKNSSRGTLQEAELTVVLPSDAVLVKGGREMPAPQRVIRPVDDLRSGEERTVEISVRLFGKEGDGEKVEAALLYRPEGLRARFSAEGEKTFFISRVPLSIFWNVPDLLSEGQKVSATVRYASDADRPLENLSLRLQYPPGFIFVSANPKPDVGDAIWRLGTLSSGAEGTIALEGTVSGSQGEVKTFRAELGVLDEFTKDFAVWRESSKESQMALIPLSARGFLLDSRDHTITPGEELRGSIRYRNNTQFTLRNVSVRASLEGSILEFETLDVGQGGVFDFASRSIVWGPSGTPELREVEPGEEGVFSFSIRTKENPAVRGPSDFNQTVMLRSSIKAASVPQELAGTGIASGDELIFKVNSRVIFGGKALFRFSPILNSGPLPPRVGTETSYAVLWEIRNFTNDLHNAEVRASVPPNVRWTGVTSPSGARITFDPASGEVRWFIGAVEAGIGVLAPALAGAFQVSITPSEADLGKSVTLLGESVLTATDSFTQRAVEMRMPSLSTELKKDPTTSSGDWTVTR